MKNIKVIIQPPKPNDKCFDWPYSQLPRVGDKFCFEDGVHLRVRDVFFNHVKGGGDFVAVVPLEEVA
jgi:hypothetical protein